MPLLGGEARPILWRGACGVTIQATVIPNQTCVIIDIMGSHSVSFIQITK